MRFNVLNSWQCGPSTEKHSSCLPKVDYVVEPIKSKDVVLKTILSGSTLAMWTPFLPKCHDITFIRSSNRLSVVSLNFCRFCQNDGVKTTVYCDIKTLGLFLRWALHLWGRWAAIRPIRYILPPVQHPLPAYQSHCVKTLSMYSYSETRLIQPTNTRNICDDFGSVAN